MLQISECFRKIGLWRRERVATPPAEARNDTEGKTLAEIQMLLIQTDRHNWDYDDVTHWRGSAPGSLV